MTAAASAMASPLGWDAPDHWTVAFVGNCPHCVERGVAQAEALLGVVAENSRSTPVTLNEIGALVQTARLTVLTDATSISVLLGSMKRLTGLRAPSPGAFLCLPPEPSVERDARHQPATDGFTARVVRHRLVTPHTRRQIVLDPRKGELRKGNFHVRVTPIQSRMLRALLVEPGLWVSATTLTKAIYGDGHAGDESLLRVHVRKLRAVLEAASRVEPHSAPAIQVESARGWGYRVT